MSLFSFEDSARAAFRKDVYAAFDVLRSGFDHIHQKYAYTNQRDDLPRELAELRQAALDKLHEAPSAPEGVVVSYGSRRWVNWARPHAIKDVSEAWVRCGLVLEGEFARIDGDRPRSRGDISPGGPRALYDLAEIIRKAEMELQSNLIELEGLEEGSDGTIPL